jgi:hypothetical protein
MPPLTGRMCYSVCTPVALPRATRRAARPRLRYLRALCTKERIGMRSTDADAELYRRAAKRQNYEDFCKYAKAPPMRRSIAAAIDMALGIAPSAYVFSITGNPVSFLLLILYMLVRDSGGRSIGKRLSGLVVVHPETFSPCTLNQSLIRNSLYAVICPLFLAIGLVSAGLAGLIFAVAFFLSALSRVNVLFFLGYDQDTGRTIPDSWAQTHVLTPKEIGIILKMKRELETPAVQAL